MPRLRAFAAFLALAFMTPACSYVGSKLRPPAPSPTPDTLVSKLGTSMPLDKAVRHLAFRPFIPSQTQLMDVALISPLSDADTRKTIGIAFEYASAGQAMVLQEWPLGKVHLVLAGVELGATPCKPEKFKTDGMIWTTPRHLVMALQADGKIKPSRILTEARRLMIHGACS
ncbi:MAG: hypothetical protein NVS9B12_10930 [Vulcanimicrobiaceae bacterium]